MTTLDITMLSIWVLFSIKIANRIHELEQRQDSINKMVIEHLNQLLTDVEALVEDHNNV